MDSYGAYCADEPRCLRPISSPDVVIEKYPGSRYWAVRLHGELLVVTVYKKGALAVKSALLQLA